jgi:hypothetical protein
MPVESTAWRMASILVGIYCYEIDTPAKSSRSVKIVPLTSIRGGLKYRKFRVTSYPFALGERAHNPDYDRRRRKPPTREG